jgi:iron complex outermembrane receptor protein
MMRIIVILCGVFGMLSVKGAAYQDTIPQLNMVNVQGFGMPSSRLMLPASVSRLKEADLQRFQGTSLLPAMNTIPGVRMEERSPGSYRLSIRGSLLRSPFGVRNVKLYLDDFILTDAGGNTYLNLLDLNTIGGAEVLRGPAGSTYGTGTGGVVLLSGTSPEGLTIENGQKASIEIGLSAGSYGLFSENLTIGAKHRKGTYQLNQGLLQSDGYRENSRMQRNVIQWSSTHEAGSKGKWKTLFLFSDLDYRTPGGLTAAQLAINPRQARPATAVLPGALSQRAGIHNRTALFGLSYKHEIDQHWSFTSSLTQSLTDFRNPFISNYEKRQEYNLGIRQILNRKSQLMGRPLNWQSGIEWQRGWYTIDSTGNKAGIPDDKLVRDKVAALQAFLFTQADYKLSDRLLLQAGVSLNRFNYHIDRTVGLPEYQVSMIDFDLQFVPRVAFSYAVDARNAVHLSLTRGFSPPSLAEIRPSAGGLSVDLQAEQGWSREIGWKGSIIKGKFQYDLTYFQFNLKDAIVRRTNAAGAEYFTNAGEIRQQGLEAFLQGYLLHRNRTKGLMQLKAWTAISLSDFRFGNYRSGAVSMNDKYLTGVPRRNVTTGLDLTLPTGLYLAMTHQFTDSLPLTDINDAFAGSYHLLGSRVGWKGRMRKMSIELFVAGDNLLDQQYSLGNDINAFGRRFFNPAPGRNWVAGLKVGI